MPPRLQAPLWRSPSSSPRKHTHHHHRRSAQDRIETSRPFDEDSIDLAEFYAHQRRHDVDAHKQQISRHRVVWPRAKTPPGYWDIGEVYERLIEDTYGDENVIDGIWEVYHSWIDAQISDYNTDFYYQPRDYIAECYKKGVVL